MHPFPLRLPAYRGRYPGANREHDEPSRGHIQIFRTVPFANTLVRAEEGLIDADLGGGVIKQYESKVLASVHEAALGLSEAGVMCLTSVEDTTPEEEMSRPTLKLGSVSADG